MKTLLDLCKSKKFIQACYNDYRKSTKENIYQAYGKPSREKVAAYSNCEEKYRELNGRNMRVVGASTYIFTVGFTALYENKECFIYITPQHVWYIPLEELNYE